MTHYLIGFVSGISITLFIIQWCKVWLSRKRLISGDGLVIEKGSPLDYKLKQLEKKAKEVKSEKSPTDIDDLISEFSNIQRDK